MSYEPCHWLKWNMTLLSNWLCQSVWGYFWKAPQYHYYSVWKVVYFSQNPLNLKSKKLSFQKAKFCPLVYGYINSPYSKSNLPTIALEYVLANQSINQWSLSLRVSKKPAARRPARPVDWARPQLGHGPPIYGPPVGDP